MLFQCHSKSRETCKLLTKDKIKMQGKFKVRFGEAECKILPDHIWSNFWLIELTKSNGWNTMIKSAWRHRIVISYLSEYFFSQNFLYTGNFEQEILFHEGHFKFRLRWTDTSYAWTQSDLQSRARLSKPLSVASILTLLSPIACVVLARQSWFGVSWHCYRLLA